MEQDGEESEARESEEDGEEPEARLGEVCDACGVPCDGVERCGGCGASLCQNCRVCRAAECAEGLSSGDSDSDDSDSSWSGGDDRPAKRRRVARHDAQESASNYTSEDDSLTPLATPPQDQDLVTENVTSTQNDLTPEAEWDSPPSPAPALPIPPPPSHTQDSSESVPHVFWADNYRTGYPVPDHVHRGVARDAAAAAAAAEAATAAAAGPAEPQASPPEEVIPSEESESPALSGDDLEPASGSGEGTQRDDSDDGSDPNGGGGSSTDSSDDRPIAWDIGRKKRAP